MPLFSVLFTPLMDKLQLPLRLYCPSCGLIFTKKRYNIAYIYIAHNAMDINLDFYFMIPDRINLMLAYTPDRWLFQFVYIFNF